MAPKIIKFDAKDLDRVEYTPEEIKRALEYPSDFGYHGGNVDLFKTWTLGPVFVHRDSDLLTESNAACLLASLREAFPEDEEWTVEHCGHWAVGWCDHLSFRIVESDGTTITPVARWIKCFFDMIEEYPVADEDDWSDREYEFALESIQETLRSAYYVEGFKGASLKENLDPVECAEIVRSAMCENGEELPRENCGRDERILEIAADRDMLEFDDDE